MRSNQHGMHRAVIGIALLLGGMALLAVTGCGSDDAPPAETPAAPPTVPDTTELTPPASAELTNAKGRVIILGFDGVEPTILEPMMDAGETPNLAKLRDSGSYARLASSIPPQSPTAWSSFITGNHAGEHGIYDFLRRIPNSPVGGGRIMPAVGYTQRTHAEVSEAGQLVKPASMENLRKGEPFWMPVDRAGGRSKILHVPFAFPADNLRNGYMLCGLGVPDLRNTDSTFYSFAEEYTEQASVSGGIRIPLRFEGDKATVKIPGARDMRKSSRDAGAYVEADVSFSVDRGAGSITIDVPGKSMTLTEGEWSQWVEWDFAVSDSFHVKAISRFHVMNAKDKVKVYMSCLQFHPDDPYIPFSHPENYSAELKERFGLYKTVGWIYDTHALRLDAMSEDTFLEDARATMAWREELVLSEMDLGDFDLLIGAWTATDRVAHLFWRFRDPGHPLYTEEGAQKYGTAVEDTYRKMDEIVGKVVERMEPDDLLMILSDHGFHSFRYGFNVNTWLVRNGYLAVEGQDDPATAVNTKEFLDGYDWAKTKAYSLGLGSIFLNLAGREAHGSVSESEADAVIAEIAAKLAEVTDPNTGDKVFSAIYTRNDFEGAGMADAPDIQLGYAPGYQSAKDAVKGVAPAEMFEPTTDKWSGEHAASDFKITPGIFFSNQAIANDSPAIVDLGVAALNYLGVPVPDGLDGKELF